MLQIKDIRKEYRTGDLVQTALAGVTLSFRDSEFVAILGPSGSGKTTLLNVIGGLDRYDSGELLIDGVATSGYSDRDWDSYRNHSVGFVFQSYNLIPHQSVLANVELALTISGVPKVERKRRATEALEKVGLGDQLHKRPAQMSGGQMQRVAIARALVNDPKILLADEPTGALDTQTSLQVMELLKEVAQDRLVVMVTHNPELARDYATRIVSVKDGLVVGDTDPFVPPATAGGELPGRKNMGRASMSLSTALSLSFDNLRTKLARTLLTSFAGSIGIIGIALILSLSTGVNTYITDIQRATMTSYPITIDAQAIDLAGIMQAGAAETTGPAGHEMDGVYSDVSVVRMASAFNTSFTSNNLTPFKAYLDDPESPVRAHLGDSGVVYTYNPQFSVFTHDPEGVFIDTNGVVVDPTESFTSSSAGMESLMAMSSMATPANTLFEQMLPGKNGELVGAAVTDAYELVHGSWPGAFDEVLLVLNDWNEVSVLSLYELGLLPSSEYDAVYRAYQQGAPIAIADAKWTYEEACEQTFSLVPACDRYVQNADGTFSLVTDEAELEKIARNAVQLKIVGVIRPKPDANGAFLNGTVAYTKALTDHVIAYTEQSPVVVAQKADPATNVLTGRPFSQPGAGGVSLFGTAVTASAASYDKNMGAFGVVNLDAPSSISIYVDTFEAKDAVGACIEEYNASVPEEDQIAYTDYIGLLLSSVTDIVDVVSYILIAFVAVSLVVSSIMIGIITYISVLERTKEIGILRSMGASKRNVATVFNAETFITGVCSGLIGVGSTLLILIPVNMVIHMLAESTSVNAILPWQGAVVLVALSVGLTVVGGLIPSGKAARMDPVAALRSE